MNMWLGKLYGQAAKHRTHMLETGHQNNRLDSERETPLLVLLKGIGFALIWTPQVL